MHSSGQFGFSFLDNRKAEPENVMIDTKNSTIVMMEKYVQLDLQMPSRRIYGLGERKHEFTLGEGTWTMWANGQVPQYDDGSGGMQSYGVHPFALVQSGNKGEFIGVFFRQSVAMSPFIKYTGTSTCTLSYIATGGDIEIYFFFKGTAKQIIREY